MAKLLGSKILIFLVFISVSLTIYADEWGRQSTEIRRFEMNQKNLENPQRNLTCVDVIITTNGNDRVSMDGIANATKMRMKGGKINLE
jgi:hypothetical protein